MPKYTSIQDVENYLLTEIDIGFEPQVEKWIDAVEKFIDKYTGRNFKADATASVKKYDGFNVAENFRSSAKSQKELFIDDCVEVTEVKITDFVTPVVPSTEYLLYPANSLPKRRIKLKHDSSYSFVWGEQNIEITAKWGYSVNPPADIVFAATILVAGIINYGKGTQIVRTETIGNYSVSYQDELGWQDFERAMDILNQYQKIEI